MVTRNSSGDEITNVNILYDNIVHVLQNTIDYNIVQYYIYTILLYNRMTSNGVIGLTAA